MSGEGQMFCWECRGLLTGEDLGRQGVCPRCGRYTHVCRNCRFYDPGSYNQCREPVAERVVDKDKANFCDFFKGAVGKACDVTSRDDPFAAAAALFRR